MSQEDCNSTSKADPSSERTLAGVAWYEEQMNPSYRRNMPQSQRDRLARLLRHIRRENFQEAQSDSIGKSAAPTDQSAR